MKPFLSILLTAALLLSLAACGGNSQTTPPPSSVNPPSQSVSEAPSSGGAPMEPESGTENGPSEPEENTENGQPENETDAGTPGEEETAGSHILIAYFTVPETDGVDTVANASRVATENGVMGIWSLSRRRSGRTPAAPWNPPSTLS